MAVSVLNPHRNRPDERVCDEPNPDRPNSTEQDRTQPNRTEHSEHPISRKTLGFA